MGSGVALYVVDVLGVVLKELAIFLEQSDEFVG
jgi:hypothetical protein